MQDFRNLQVWQKAHELALLTYRVTEDFPRDEMFGLRNMMRKASIDISAYIAEGSAKTSDVEFSKSLSASLAVSNRLEYYGLMASDLGFFKPDAYDNWVGVLIEVKKLINGFNRRLAAP